MYSNFSEYESSLEKFIENIQNNEYHLWEELKVKTMKKDLENILNLLISKDIKLNVYVLEIDFVNYLMSSFDLISTLSSDKFKNNNDIDLSKIEIKIVNYQENYYKLKEQLKINDFLSIREKNKLKIKLEEKIENSNLVSKYKKHLEQKKSNYCKLYSILDFMETNKDEIK